MQLSSTVFLPMSEGLAQIIRRWPSFVIALAFFALAIQGVGSGATVSLASIVISDMMRLSRSHWLNGERTMAFSGYDQDLGHSSHYRPSRYTLGNLMTVLYTADVIKVAQWECQYPHLLLQQLDHSLSVAMISLFLKGRGAEFESSAFQVCFFGVTERVIRTIEAREGPGSHTKKANLCRETDNILYWCLGTFTFLPCVRASGLEKAIRLPCKVASKYTTSGPALAIRMRQTTARRGEGFLRAIRRPSGSGTHVMKHVTGQM
ncbi:hypothetical protein BKA70DRAFT_1219068 [Coprinopsis sp. MPI-PUGE-AT-0042]|nr:hypothetical protein BKA70DRAFT_1219068 [Coprinopsis sp. MPI-PUGE-AT-0042]